MNGKDLDNRLLLACTLVVVGAVYARVVGLGYLQGFDDGLYLINRPEIRDWWGVGWWRRLMTPDTGYGVPVPTFVYAHVKQAFPDAFPGLLHGLNLAGHLVNTALVFLLVRRWERDRLALAVCALWGLHPACVETVAWLTNLKGIFYGTGLFGTLLIWQRHLETPISERSRWGPALACLALFLFALGSRPEAALFPLGMAWLAWREDELGGAIPDLAVAAGPMVAVSGLYLPAALRGQDEVVQSIDLGAVGPIRHLHRMLRGLEMNLRNLFWPAELHPGYFLAGDETWVDAIPGGLLLSAIVGVAVVSVLREDRRLLFPLGLGALLYAPYSQLLTLPRLAADSYLYAPGVAGLLAAVVVVDRMLERVDELADPTRLRRVTTVAFAAVFAVLTALQVGRWRSNAALWGPVLEDHPRLWKPYYTIAREYMADGEWQKSAALLEEGIPLFRENRVYPSYMPMVLERVGQPRRAMELAYEAIRRDRNPHAFHYQVYLGLLARNDFEPPDVSEELRWTRRAVDRFTDEQRWMKKRRYRLSLSDYFTRRDYGELAVPFLAREFRSARPHCRAWMLAERLSSQRRRSVDVPPHPARCDS